MSKHFYAPVVVRTDEHSGHDVIPAPEIIDRACKCQELRACPVRACIEFIGGRQEGFGSCLARGKRYLRKNCKCSGVEVKMTYLVYYKRNSEFAEFYGLNVVKYSEDEFDNKVCYWVMTATPFCDILSGKKVGLGEDKQDESIPFIFQEANFYVNKSIDKLDVMKPCAEVIFNKGVAYSKLIDAYRLETVIYILKEVRKKSYSSEKELEENGNLSQEGIQMVAKQKECDKEYNQKIRLLIGATVGS